MSSWCRCGSDWETRDVQWRWRLERSSKKHALVSVESQCSKLLWRAQPDDDPVAAVVEQTWKIPIVTDNTTMTGAERRLSMQLYCGLALTCRKRAMQVVQQVPRGHGFEAWRQLCRKFGPHPPVRSRGMLQVLLSSTKSAELKRLVRQWRKRGKVCEEQSGDEVSDRQSARPTTRDRARQETAEFLRARQACAVSGNANVL